MPIYFIVLDGRLFHDEIRPALTASWKCRSFEPCRKLCAALEDASRSFQRIYHTGSDEPLLRKIAGGLTFDRHFWQLLVGEVMLFAAKEIPEFPVAPLTLGCLLAPAHPDVDGLARERYPPIYQAHYGSRYLEFGNRTYRPDHAGINDLEDVSRLANYLNKIDPLTWHADDLLPLGVEEEMRTEELKDAQAWFQALLHMYARAQAGRSVVICEEL
jgi:hypothetical protein